MANKEQICRIGWDEDNVGKNVKASKKRVTWTFEIEGDRYVVQLVHSRVSGKKTVFLNNEVVCDSSKNSMGDWSTTMPVPGFPCPKGKEQHLCRVLISATPKGDDSAYCFFVDNVNFVDLPSRRMKATRGVDNSRGQTSLSSKQWGPTSAPVPAPAPAPAARPPTDLLSGASIALDTHKTQDALIFDQSAGAWDPSPHQTATRPQGGFDPFNSGNPSPTPALQQLPPPTSQNHRTGPDVMGDPLMDLAGLSFDTPINIPTEPAPVAEKEDFEAFQDTQDSEPKSVEASLVDLDDITGEKKKNKGTPKKHAPSMNQMSSSQQQQAKKSSMNTMAQGSAMGISTMGMAMGPMGGGMPPQVPLGMAGGIRPAPMGMQQTMGMGMGQMQNGQIGAQQPLGAMGISQMGQPHIGVNQQPGVGIGGAAMSQMPRPPTSQQQGGGAIHFDAFIGLR